MNIVETAALVPAMCCFTKTSNGPFIDLQRDFDYDHVGRIYVKTSFARELGVLAGNPSQERVDELESEVERLSAENAVLLEELKGLREFNEAARYTVETLGHKVRRKPGPRPQQPTAA